MWYLIASIPELCTLTYFYSDSEFVIANTLAKKLEPNEINFSQRVVSTICFVFHSLCARGDFCCVLIIFANILDPDQV